MAPALPDVQVSEAAEWLRRERRRLGASTTLLARLSTLIAARAGDPVIIHQQQISYLENAGPDRGPRRLRPWFRHVRAAFDTGLVAEAVGTPSAPPPPTVERIYRIVNEGGQVVGRLSWSGSEDPFSGRS